MLDTATIDPPEPASTIARATARIVSQVPVRLVSMTRCQSAALLQQQPGRPDACARDESVGRPVLGDRLVDRGGNRVGIADVAIDVAAVDVPHHHVVASRAQPVDDRTADAGPAAGDDVIA